MKHPIKKTVAGIAALAAIGLGGAMPATVFLMGCFITAPVVDRPAR